MLYFFYLIACALWGWRSSVITSDAGYSTLRGFFTVLLPGIVVLFILYTLLRVLTERTV